MKRKILFLLSLCLVILSCSKDEDPYLSISKTEVSITDTGGSQSIMIDTNEGWTARSSQAWCTVSPADGGSSERSAQITAEANDTHNDRSCIVTFTVGSISRTVNVTQGQKGGLLVTKNSFDISSVGQIVEVELKTNIEVEVVIPQEAKSWVSYVGTRALESKTLSLNVNENSEYSNRSAKIVIKNSANNLQETVTITQDADKGLIIGNNKFELSNEGGIIEVNVKANVEYEVEISDKWITQVETRGLIETTLQFQVAKNKNHDNRAATITISQKDGELSSTIKVYQAQEDAIILSNKNVDISNEAQNVEVELKTNIDVEVIIPKAAQGWVSYIGTRGLSTEMISLNVDKNAEYKTRSTEIYFKNKATNLQDTLVINQDSNKGLIIGNDKFELSNEGGIIEVNVKANVEYKVEISDKWITQVETRGLTETTLQFQVAKNKNHDNRAATITISQKDGELSSTIKVYQTQEDAIILSENKVDISNEDQTIDVKIITNIDFEVIIPKEVQGWVSRIETRGLRLETVSFDIKANSEYDKRTAEVYIKNSETNIQDTLTINQDALLGLLVSQDAYELTSESTSIAVEVQANVEYEVVISDDWITQVSTRGLTTTNLTFNIAENDTYANREGTITFNQKCGDLSSTITISQLQNSAIIISETEYDISSRSNELEIKLNTNVDYEIIIPEEAKSWVSYIETRALRAETVVLNIAENSSEKMRSTKVQIKGRATDFQETITINQMGNVPGVYWVDKMGTLGTILSQTQKDTITTMVVKGEINKADFEVMKRQMPKLRFLDLKDVKCEGDEIPYEAFGTESGFAHNVNDDITSIIFPTTLTKIGDYAFNGCTGLSGSLNLPNGLTSIGKLAFFSCTGFTGSLNLPEGLISIGYFAFGYCGGFNGALSFSSELKTIGERAFENCIGFTVLSLPDGLIEIGNSAFANCSGFSGSLSLPSSLTKIGYSAFFNCTGFSGSLILPNRLATIESSVFSGCTGFSGSLKLPDSLTIIEGYAFSNCSGFSGSLILPDGLTTIGDGAFSNCSGFSGSLKLPGSLTTIGDGAFSNCSGFSGSLILPEKLTTISKMTFLGCSGFTGSLNLPVELKTIETQAFAYCSEFTELVLGNKITTINEYAFQSCENISGSVVFPISLTSIRNEGFNKCNKVNAFRFPHTTPLPYYPSMLPPNATVEVPNSAVETYKATGGWQDYNIIGY